MKKLIATMFGLILALPLVAAPPATSDMIRTLVEERTVAMLLDGIEEITIKRVPLSDDLKRRCSNYSDDGAVLKITTIRENKKNVEVYYSTERNPDDMRGCI